MTEDSVSHSLWDALGERNRMLLCDRYGLDEGQLRLRLRFASDVQAMIFDTFVLEPSPPHEWRPTKSGYTICGRCGTYRDFGGEKVRCNPVAGHAPGCTAESRCCTDAGHVIPRTTDA